MFRFTEWQEQGHDFRAWQKHFDERTIRTEVRPCAHGMVALFRDGAESVDKDALGPFELSRVDYERRYGCECGWTMGWEGRRGARPGVPVPKRQKRSAA